MKAPKLTKEDKRTIAEKRMDEAIDYLAEQAIRTDLTDEDRKRVEDQKSQINDTLDLMKKREELKGEKTKKIDPNQIINLAANTAWIALILHAEDVRSITSKAMNFVFRGRLR